MKKEIIPIGLIVLMFLAAFYLYPTMPERMPVHWNAKGKIDGYGSRNAALFLLPVVNLVIYGLFLLIPKIAVFRENVKEFYGRFGFDFRTVIVVFFFVLYLATLMPPMGYSFNMGYVVMPAVALLIFYMGYLMRHMKRNFFMGIRTPWTLSNDIVWKKTHDVGGRLFQVWGGIMLLVVIFVPSGYIMWFIMVPILAIVTFVFVYSYKLYQQEKGKGKAK